MKELETERLLLRKVRVDDAEPLFYNITSSDAVTRYLTWHTHRSISDTVAYVDFCLEDYKNLRCYRWAIELKETGDVIGMIDVVGFNEGEPEIGYMLAEKEWGCGYMTEALTAVLRYLMFEEGFKTVFARADNENIGSNRVLEKCGFHFVSQAEEPVSQSKPEIATVNKYRINKKYSEFLEREDNQ